MLAIALLLWRVVPNRRYGAALGAVVGLGFGIGGEAFVQSVSQLDPGHVVLALVFLTLIGCYFGGLHRSGRFRIRR